MRSLLVAMVAVLMMVGAVSAADQPIVIKFSHVTTRDTPKGLSAEKFKELAEAKTDGRAKVEIYPNSQLYKDKEELEALQLGAVQAGALAREVRPAGSKGVRGLRPALYLSRQGGAEEGAGGTGRKTTIR